MKLSKLLFFLSFAPAVFLLMAAEMSIFTGSTWFFSKEYGFDAFISTLMLGGLAMCYIPILPACLIYQVVYVLLFKVPKGLPDDAHEQENADETTAQEAQSIPLPTSRLSNKKTQKEKNEQKEKTAHSAAHTQDNADKTTVQQEPSIPVPTSRLSNKTKSIIAVSLFAVMVIVVLGKLFMPKIKKSIEEHKAQRMYENAEVRLDYNKTHEYLSGMLGIKEQTCPCVLIDYDKMRIGLLVSDDPGYNDYIEYDLTAADKEAADRLNDKYIVQTQTTLPDGGKFTAFRNDNDHGMYTKALMLEKSDGSIYINDDLGIGDGAFTQLGNAFETDRLNNE